MVSHLAHFSRSHDLPTPRMASRRTRNAPFFMHPSVVSPKYLYSAATTVSPHRGIQSPYRVILYDAHCKAISETVH